MDAFLAEARIPSPPGKEVLEGFAQLDDRLLGGALGDLQHPRILLALEVVELTAQRRF